MTPSREASCGDRGLVDVDPGIEVHDELVKQEPIVSLLRIIFSFNWTDDLLVELGPDFHLIVSLTHREVRLLETNIYVEGGRIRPVKSGLLKGTELEGILVLDLSRLLDLLDPATPDPLMAVLAPSTRIEMPFESLLYFGGMAEAWIPALRKAVPPELVVACRAHLAGSDVQDSRDAQGVQGDS